MADGGMHRDQRVCRMLALLSQGDHMAMMPVLLTSRGCSAAMAAAAPARKPPGEKHDAVIPVTVSRGSRYL